MGELVDEQQRRAARDGGVDIELHERAVAVGDRPAWQHFESFEQCCGLGTPMRFDYADDDIEPSFFSARAADNMAYVLPTPGRHAKKHLELAAPFIGGKLQQCLGRGAPRIFRP